MTEIIIKENESLDDAMKRFKKKVQDAGVLQEMKKREFYEPPSVRKKQKMWAASKKRKKVKRRV
ncbi:MAG: 30S ribosomal protein S21 [bacterium]|jgi:small subunit ribosomal protein S21